MSLSAGLKSVKLSGVAIAAVLALFAFGGAAIQVHAQSPSTGFTLSTYDNDFLWTSANAFYAPATPFGTWSATPEGCSAPVAGTGICASSLGTNGYANLGGSLDYGPLVLDGNTLHTSLTGLPNGSATLVRSGGLWVMKQSTHTFPASHGLTLSMLARSWLNFGGNSPSQSNFQNGLLVLAFFVHLPQSASAQVTNVYPDASFVSNSLGWIVNYQIIIQESQCFPSSCPIPSPYFYVDFPSSIRTNTFTELVGGTSITATTTGGVTSYTTNGATTTLAVAQSLS